MDKKLTTIVSRMNLDLKNKIAFSEKEKDIHNLIQKEQYVGDVVNLTYTNAKIQINDAYRKKVGGIPAQCFLIATRIDEKDIDYDEEDCSVILLRVMDAAQLPWEYEKERVVVENIENNCGLNAFWDDSLQDAKLKNMLSFGAVTCRVIGTFYMDKHGVDYKLQFGNDLSNFYPSKSLKVYKPSLTALETIVNYGIESKNSVGIGKVRYSSTNRRLQGVDEVNVVIDPRDLIAQKTAVFGMTRTGKSNTVKTIAKSIYQLRQKINKKIGQLIFDANGEYANENVQDKNDLTGQAQALKNVWKEPVNGEYGSFEDVVTYGLLKNQNDPNRIVMKINFYDDFLIQIGKELIDDKLNSDIINNVQYIKSFTSVSFNHYDNMSHSEIVREKRNRLVYKTILNMSGFKDNDLLKKESGLFSQKLIKYISDGIKGFDGMADNKKKEVMKKKEQYTDCALILTKLSENGVSYSELGTAFEILQQYITDVDSTYYDFEKEYVGTGEEPNWLDVNLSSLLMMFAYKNSFKKIAKAVVYHDSKSSKKDYAQMIYDDLVKGKLVIVDQSLGDSDLNRLAAERILRRIFEENNKQFSEAITPSSILIFVEEAHNLMPKGSEEDTTNIWARVAKEGAKFNIGMIYSTQEVSSIQKNILKNTTNWFISHLNNKEEIRALSDFYDFEDFSLSILQAEDKGFIRMKTKSNRFVVPIQVNKFQISDI